LDESTASAAAKEAEEKEEVKRRRPRYQGKYPRNFTEKYKELGGDESTIQKVLQKGMTPAGTHVPIMLEECLQYMGIQKPMSNDNHVIPDDATSGVVDQDQEDNDQPALVVDCTLGYGGHSSHLIQALLLDKRTKKNGSTTNPTTRHRLIAFDQDSIEIQKTDERLRATYNLQQKEDQGSDETNNNSNLLLFTTVHQNFATLGHYLQASGDNGRVTSLLADLGLSSMQIDNNERGFTYKREGPLDMRMNTNTNSNTNSNPATSDNTSSPQVRTETAYDLLCRLTPKELKSMLEENSDEVYATEIANGILLKQQQPDSAKKKKNSNSKNNTDKEVIPKTTTELADRVRAIVEPLMLTNSSGNNNKGKSNNNKAKLKAQLDSTVARVMQAIRIELNGEFRALDQLLADLPTILAPNGRAVFLTFHSGEDRRVKKAFKSGYTSGIYSSWCRDVVRPTAQERRDNPRSSCCKLRWVVRSDKVI
jgi:16S rRNA (cytosine1402-N4)-methyltransferase